MEEQAQQLAVGSGVLHRNPLAILPRAGLRDDTAQPIFILGFPRSGPERSSSRPIGASAHLRGDELRSSTRLPRR